MTQGEFSVDGFNFANAEDAKLANAELKRIEQLEQKIDHKNPHLVSAVYEKAVANSLFKTPVGICYLKGLQTEIKKSPLVQNEISDIPVNNIISEEKVNKEVSKEVKKEIKKATDKKEIITRKVSLAINAVLILVVVILFYISFTATNPNIINYEYNLQNKYASWSEELNAREQVIREKERELMISTENE